MMKQGFTRFPQIPTGASCLDSLPNDENVVGRIRRSLVFLCTFALRRLCVASNFSSARRWPVIALAVWIPALLTACAQPTPVALIFNAAPWQDGEEHVFRITDVQGRLAGTATYTLLAGVNDQGQPMWSIERIIDAQGDREEVTVKVLAAGFRPQSSFLERSNATGAETVDAQYNGPAVDLVLTTRANIMTTQRIEVPSDVRESATLPMIVRALPLARNYATRLNAFLPVAGLLDRVTVRVVGEERLSVPAGAYDAWVVVLDMGDSTTRLWIAKEAPYPLVKYIDGRNRATFELERYVVGR
jgi:hypothetical protein